MQKKGLIRPPSLGDLSKKDGVKVELDCLGVPQGFYYRGQPNSDIGTSSLASCCAVIGVNSNTRNVFFAHVDAGKSATKVQDLLNQIEPESIEIYRGSSESQLIKDFIDDLQEAFGDRLVTTVLKVGAVVLKIEGQGFKVVVCDDIRPSNANDYKFILYQQVRDNKTDALLPMP